MSGQRIDHRKVREALRSKATTLSNSIIPASNRLWEGRATNMPEPGTGLVMLEKLTPTSDRLVAFDQVESRGFVTYSILGPSGEGTEKIEDAAAALGALFKLDAGITHNGVSLAIDRVELGGIAPFDDSFQGKPVRVYWRMYTSVS